jgi:hypothetical protein
MPLGAGVSGTDHSRWTATSGRAAVVVVVVFVVVFVVVVVVDWARGLVVLEHAATNTTIGTMLRHASLTTGVRYAIAGGSGR